MGQEDSQQKLTTQEIKDKWKDIQSAFELLYSIEFDFPLPETQQNEDFLSNNMQLSWEMQKDAAFLLLSEKHNITERKLRKNYHEFVCKKQKNHPTRFLLWPRSWHLGFIGISARYAVIAGAIAAFLPIYNFGAQLAESNRLRQEEILQARRNAVQQGLSTLQELDADDGSLKIKNAIELLAMEGRSLDDVELDGYSISLLNVSPENLRAIRQSFTVQKQGPLARWVRFWKTSEDQNTSEDCALRLGTEGLASRLPDKIYCVSLERASFRGAKLQNSNFKYANLLQANFNPMPASENEAAPETSGTIRPVVN